MSYRGNNSSNSSDDDDDEMDMDPQMPPLYGPPSSNRGIRQIIDPNSVQMPQLYRRTEPTERPSLRSQFSSTGTSAPRLKSGVGQYNIAGKTTPTSDLKRSLKSDLPDPKRRLPPLPPQSIITRPADQQNEWNYTRSSDQLPRIVQKYRNPYTGEPNLNVMRKDIDIERGQLEDQSRSLHEILSFRHKRRSQEIKKDMEGRTGRQIKQMKKMGYNLDKNTRRYIKEGGGTTGSQITTTPTATTGRQTPRLERSQSMPELSALGEVSGKISQMGSQRRSKIMPTGRLGYGFRWSPELSRAFSADNSCLTTGKFHGEDISSYTPKERAFSLRLKQRPDDELELYRKYRNMADPMHRRQSATRKRMHHLSSPYGRHLADSERVREIRGLQNKMLWTEEPPPNDKGVENMRQFRRFLTGYRRALPSTDVEDYDNDYEPKYLNQINETKTESLSLTADAENKKQFESYDRRFQHELRKIKERSIPSMFGQIHEKEEEEDDEQQQQQMEMETEEKSDYEHWLKDYQQKHEQPEGGPRDKSPEPPPNPNSCPTQ